MVNPFIQFKFASASSNQVSAAFDSANTLKSLLIASCAFGAAVDPSVLTIEDTQGNTWYKLDATNSASKPQNGGPCSLALFYCLSAKAGANTVTAKDTSLASGSARLVISEYGGINWTLGAHPAPQVNGYSSGSFNAPITTTFLHTLLVAGIAAIGNVVINTGSGWNARSQDASGTWDLAYGYGDTAVDGIGDYAVSGTNGWHSLVIIGEFYDTQEALAVNLGTLQDGVVDQAYICKDGTITEGGPPYSATISAGALPLGIKMSLLLDPNDTKIIFAGLPLKAGTFNFTVEATDNLGNIGHASGSITITGDDMNCPCGTATKVELVSFTDYHYTESVGGPNWMLGAPGAYIDYDFPAKCCPSMGCLFNYCSNNPNIPNPTSTSWTDHEQVTDITHFLTERFGGNLAAMLGSLSVLGAACIYGGYWDGRDLMIGDGTYAQSCVLTFLDLFVVVTYSNGHKLISRPQSSKALDGSSFLGKRFGVGLGSQLWQWGVRTLGPNPWNMVFYGFETDTAPAVCPSEDCLPVASPFGAACSGVSGVSAYPAMFSVSAYGGTPPYTFAKSGTWPSWLDLDTASGIISGTLGTAGSYSVSVRVTDSAAGDITVTCSVTVADRGNGCEPGFTLEKLVVTLRPDRHGPVRGAAQ